LSSGDERLAPREAARATVPRTAFSAPNALERCAPSPDWALGRRAR